MQARPDSAVPREYSRAPVCYSEDLPCRATILRHHRRSSIRVCWPPQNSKISFPLPHRVLRAPSKSLKSSIYKASRPNTFY